MAPTVKIREHPDLDLLVQKLTSGESVRDVAAFLADRYPAKSQSHLRLSPSTIQSFRSDHLNLSGQVLADLTNAALQTKEAIKSDLFKEEVRQLPTYQEKLMEIVDEKLDTQKELVEIFYILKAQTERMYNKVTQNDFNDKQERAFSTYLSQMLDTLAAYKKYVDGHVDVTRHEVSISVMNDQVSLLRETVREVLVEMDPALAVQFMGKLNTKLKSLSFRGTETDLPVNNLSVEDSSGSR